MSFPSVFTRTACFPLASEYARENVMNTVFKTDNFQFFVSECVLSQSFTRIWGKGQLQQTAVGIEINNDQNTASARRGTDVQAC